VYYYEGWQFLLLIVIARFSIRVSIAIYWSYCSEIYGTGFRATGTGIADMWSSLSGVLVPIVSIWLFDMDPFLPYLFLAIFALISAVCSYLLPYELLGKSLDLSQDEIRQLIDD